MPAVISNPTHLDQCTPARIWGRGSSGVGAGEEIEVGTGLTLSGSTLSCSLDLTPYALLPDPLPSVGTLLSYGGSRQLAAGGTVTHSGALNIGTNAFTCGAITASGIVRAGSQTGDYTAVEYYGSTYKTSVLTGYGLTHYADVHSFRGASGAAGAVRFVGMDVYLGAINTTGSDIGLIRSSATVLDLRSDGGTRFRNFANSADAPITCGAITASGVVGLNRAGVTNVPLSIQTNATSSDGVYLYNGSGTLVSDFGVTGGGHLRWRFRNSSSTTVVTINTDGVSPSIECAAITASGDITMSGVAKGIYLSPGGTAKGLIYASGLENRLYANATYCWVVESDLGLKIRNAANSADAPITCGAITTSGSITLSDVNVITGTTTGTIFATSASQKQAWWGATPIVQPTTAVAAATLVSNGGTALTDTDTFDGYTLKQIVKALRIAGLLA